MVSTSSELGRQGRVIGVLGLFLQKVNYTHPHTHTVHSGDLDHFSTIARRSVKCQCDAARRI